MELSGLATPVFRTGFIAFVLAMPALNQFALIIAAPATASLFATRKRYPARNKKVLS